MVTIEKNKGPSLIKSVDWFLLIVVFMLNTVGLMALRIFTVQMNEPRLFTKQLMASVIGIIAMVVMMIIDYKDLRVLSVPAYGGTMILLIAVLVIGVGREEVGTNGWIDLGPMSFQPSELGKITLVIATAVFFEKIKNGGKAINYLFLIGVAGSLVGLILLQPDFGTAVVYLFMLALMIFVFGIRYRVLVIGFATTIVALPILWFSVLEKVLQPFQINRILSFINPAAYSTTSAYHIDRATLYIGSGMLFGVDEGARKASAFVPEAETDSIFAIIGESWGFVGGALVVLLFLLLLLRCLYISHFAKDRYGAYVVIGFMAMFLFHFAENIGMNLRMFPVTGIPLPFISYGGSSIVINYVAIGIIQSISMRRSKPMFEA